MSIKTVKRLFAYLKGALPLAVLSVVFGTLFGAATVAVPFFAGKAIDNLGNIDILVRYLLIIIGLLVLAAVLQFVLIRMNNRISYSIGLNLRNATYKKMHRVKMSYIDKTSAGKLQSFIISDVETVSDGMLLFLNQFASGLARRAAEFAPKSALGVLRLIRGEFRLNDLRLHWQKRLSATRRWAGKSQSAKTVPKRIRHRNMGNGRTADAVQSSGFQRG